MEHLVRMQDTRNAYKILFRNSEGNRPLGKHIRRWKCDIKIDRRETV
jgi:hypothetical protein